MNWAGLGVSGNAGELRFRELEQFVRRLLHVSRVEPEEELFDAELSDRDQQAAVRREAARRMLLERG